MLYPVKKKTSLMNLKIKPEIHQEFRVAADLRGSTMSNLLHQFIVATIWEEKKKHPDAFGGVRFTESTPEETDSDPDKDNKIIPRRAGNNQ